MSSRLLGAAGRAAVLMVLTVAVALTALAPGAIEASAPPSQTGTLAQTSAEGTFSGEIAPSGVSLVVWNGGTFVQLEAALQSAGAESAWMSADGRWVSYTPGLPAFVNASFTAQFPGGTIPGLTAMLLVV
ncbi:MAG: hypothetical protein O2798_07010 [Chloroflexi bacterium]|nr:hypothetical protein [Chloroflexota bacterium]MDA1240576.1 hypothetical protein [Chloroflexota bacterium]